MSTIEQLTERVAELGPFQNESAARSALEATLDVLSERLLDEEIEMLSAELPAELSAILRPGSHGSRFGIDEFYEHVEQHEKVSHGFAVEHAQAVCRALSEALSWEARERLRKHLPELSALFELPEPVPPAPPHARAHLGTTLADGAPGSRRPVSTARPGSSGQTDSMACSENPHADTKLSSSRGLTQEREGRTLASGKPGSLRPISGNPTSAQSQKSTRH